MSKNKNSSTPAPQLKVTQERFQGPIPPPAILENYNAIIPNGAERIMAMAEKQAEHRQILENKVISSDILNSRLGLVFGLTIGLAGLACGTICILNGYAVVGAFLSGGTIVSLVGTFVYGSKSRKDERIQKQVSK